ncbi:MAG: thiol reductant ABC exporter subunit CydC [Proteobacteria bacterium]|nr:thiol reductant ABC exporter subunit CydC [Pseudomonadota bacterium]
MIRILKDLRPILYLFWHGTRRKLMLGMTLSAATVLSGLALLGLSGWFITATAIAGLSSATALAFDVFSPSAGIRFFALARTAGRYGERLVTHDATLRILSELRERLFRGSAAMREAEKLRMRPATLLFRLTQDIDALDSLYLRVLVPIGAAFAAALGMGVTFALIQPMTGLVLGLFLVLIGLGIPLVTARIALRPAVRRAHTLEILRSRVIDLVSGQTELAVAGQLGAQQRAIAKADRMLSDGDSQLNLVETRANVAFGIASAILISSTLLVATVLARNGEIGAPVATLAVLIAVAALEPFAALRRGAVELGRTCIAARRVGPRLSPAHERHVIPPHDNIAVCLDDITVRRETAPRPVIKSLSLSLRRGERVALIGASGAGKSTLMSVIAGEISPQGGRLEAITGTLLTQCTELFADTLRDNLRLADSRSDDDRLLQAIASAGLSACVHALPKGLDTRLGEGGLGLSGGEARRLALARLFLRETPLWLLDEPTEGLDDATARDVIDLLMANLGERTLIIATHFRREAEIADRVISMERGRIVASASRGGSEFDVMLASLRQD